MAERKDPKLRRCWFCNEDMVVTAEQIKEHWEKCCKNNNGTNK